MELTHRNTILSSSSDGAYALTGATNRLSPFAFFLFRLYLIVLIGIYFSFQILDFQIVYLIFMLSMVGLMAAAFLAVNLKVKKFYREKLERNGERSIKGNLGKWFFVSVSSGDVGALMPLLSKNLSGFPAYYSSTNVGNSDYECRTIGGILRSISKDRKRFARMWTPSKNIAGDVAHLYLRYAMEGRKFRFQKWIVCYRRIDTIGWQKVETWSISTGFSSMTRSVNQ